LATDGSIVARFGLGGRDVADRREQATVVVPVPPLMAYSTASRDRRGPRRWITSALNKPLIISARALL